MELYNCYTDIEKSLKNTDLTLLPDQELVALAADIHKMYCHTGELQDDQIVVDALLQIVQEQARRVGV